MRRSRSLRAVFVHPKQSPATSQYCFDGMVRLKRARASASVIRHFDPADRPSKLKTQSPNSRIRAAVCVI
jgi:hypothetical protein